MKIYLLLFVILLGFLGCGSKRVHKPIKTKLAPTSSLSSNETNSSQETDLLLHKENITKEDATTKVFENCFKTGVVDLQKSCKNKIDNFLRATALKNKRNIIIEVHTDKGGSEKNNLAISIKRARKTAGSLYYKEYKNSKVYYKGFGESKLIYDTQTKEANQKNRRIIIQLRPKNFVVDTKAYRLFIQTKKSLSKNTKNKKRGATKPKKYQLSHYTGEADTGWIYFGKPSLAKKFTMSCNQDKPMKIKHKSISKSDKEEFVPTFYNKKIVTSFDKKTLELYPIYIFENGKLPISNPILVLKEKNKTVKRFQTTVNSYRGKKGILYRVFVNGKKEVSCVDLVISYKDDKVSFGRIHMRDTKEFILKSK